jgi:plastocyanin
MTQMPQSGSGSKTRVVAVVVVIIVLAAVAGAYYLISTGGSSSSSSSISTGSSSSSSSSIFSSSSSSIFSSSSSSIETVVVNVPLGTGSNTSLNFTPSNITVVIGVNNTVEWMNQDNVAHTVSSTSVPPGASTFNDPLSTGGNVTITFTVAGTYQYQCNIHPTYMKGTVIVKSP